MTCDFAHSMVSMWCNSCNLVAFDRWHREWHMYKVSTTWMHFMNVNIVATNFDCDFLETWVLRHLLFSTEPHFLVSRQNCLHFLTQYLDNILDTMDRAVFWTYCLLSRNEPCVYTDCSVLGKPFFNKSQLKMYSVGPSQNYAKQLPVLFWAAVTSIFRMRLTSYKLQYGREINNKIVWNNLRKIHNVYFTIPNHHWKFQFCKLKS